MKTLIILSHPEIAESASQQFFLNAIKDQHEITVHHLEDYYATSDIDVATEIELIKSHDRLIFQFPLYWYSAPALLKEWQDVVFSATEIHQQDGTLLTNKEFGIVLSVGAKATAYQAGGREGVTIDELMRPYQAVARHMGMVYLPTFSVHQFGYLTEDARMTLLVAYQYYLSGEAATSLANRSEWLLTQLNAIGTLDFQQAELLKLEQVVAYLTDKQELISDLTETLEEF